MTPTSGNPAIPKTVLVTGAQGGLGRHVCERFVKAGGVRVIGTYHHDPAPSGDEVAWVKMDVSDPQSVRRGIAEIETNYGHVDALVHCAGGFRWKPIEKTTDDDFEFLMNVNLKSAFLLLRELVPGMKERGFGRVVLVSARSTLAPGAGVGIYTASKSGLNALVASVADEVRKLDINVNALLPTIIDTAANRKDMPNADYSTWVRPEELAEIAFSLTQPWGRAVHGALIPVAGRL